MPKVCEYCHLKVESSEATVDGKCFHTECFVCINCKQGLLNSSFRMRENVLYCQNCFSNMKAVKCAECMHLIKGNSRIEALGQFYHPKHFVCFHCKGRLVKGFYKKKMINVNGEIKNYAFCPFCEDDFEAKDCPKCNKPLNDNLVFENNQYSHMDCDSAYERTKSGDRGIYRGDGEKPADHTSVQSSSDSDDMQPTPASSDDEDKRPTEDKSESDLAFSRIPQFNQSLGETTGVCGTSIPVESVMGEKPVYREADVTSDPRDHMYGFESQGKVVDRSTELFKKEEYLPKEADMTGFQSEGNVLERSQAYGKKKPEEEKPKEVNLENFSTTGKVRDRAAQFGKQAKPLDVIEEDEKEEQKRAGFSSQGSIRDRMSLFEKPKQQEPLETINDEENEKEEQKRAGFSSQGSIRDRMSMFEKPKQQEPLETIDDEDHYPVAADKEYMEQQKKLAALPRDQLKEYSYEELTSGNLPEDVDRERKQYHLSDKEFKNIFGMSKKEFSKKSQSKQVSLRKKHNLF